MLAPDIAPVSLRVLITNLWLWPPTGTACYVRDLALELRRRGHSAAVFSSTRGNLADELRAAGVVVTGRADRLPWRPHVIHGHMHAPTRIALHHWPSVPAIHFCHDHSNKDDQTPLDPQVLRHYGVSQACVDRLLRQGAPPDQTGFLPNFVDTARFPVRGPLPERPRRALAFSNYANARSHLPAVAEACRLAGLELDVVGRDVGTIVTRPEDLLGRYDIVFAKAKAAMEAMAVGAAVILCDFAGVGPLVTSSRFDELRRLNFGFAALRDPLEPNQLLREIGRYSPAEAALVHQRIRTEASLTVTADQLLTIYRDVIVQFSREPRPSVRRRPGVLRESLFMRLARAWNVVMSPSLRARLNQSPLVRAVIAGIRRLLGQAG